MKRIEITVSDEVYNQILSYKEFNCIATDASACLQLIAQSLTRIRRLKSKLY